ncbi:protein GLUTAMINE DUMPER 2-like [Salvia hispanica]|uniref:protein GLUTAMINE DUMPER 2-like n=1 Tax=Salvia hispanica TaxID=49212 RepID=UPI002009BB2C|nr:protein GLUTAMINE DUMPER 2-like [Salvia hispanica]
MRIGIHSTTNTATFSPPAAIQRSPWHSPVPYLFGGMAAMLGLIAFALLILACSYWKLSAVEEGDVESGAGEKGEGASAEKALPVFEEKFLVIMAGEVKPTYLATARNVENKGKVGGEEEEEEEKVKKDDGNVVENGEQLQLRQQEQNQSTTTTIS